MVTKSRQLSAPLQPSIVVPDGCTLVIRTLAAQVIGPGSMPSDCWLLFSTITFHLSNLISEDGLTAGRCYALAMKGLTVIDQWFKRIKHDGILYEHLNAIFDIMILALK